VYRCHASRWSANAIRFEFVVSLEVPSHARLGTRVHFGLAAVCLGLTQARESNQLTALAQCNVPLLPSQRTRVLVLHPCSAPPQSLIPVPFPFPGSWLFLPSFRPFRAFIRFHLTLFSLPSVDLLSRQSSSLATSSLLTPSRLVTRDRRKRFPRRYFFFDPWRKGLRVVSLGCLDMKSSPQSPTRAEGPFANTN
jgi:hypothetical protein